MCTGDSTSNWEFVQMNIPLVLGIGLSAQPVSGCDIGGFCADWQVRFPSFNLHNSRFCNVRVLSVSNVTCDLQQALVKP